MEPHWLHWLQGLALGRWVRDSVLVYPALELLHLFGAILLAGPLIVLDLRLLGLFRRLPLAGVASLAPALPLAGLVLAAGTGGLLFLADPAGYLGNRAFQAKLVLLLAGLGNAAAFHAVLHRRLVRAPPDGQAPDAVPPAARVAAGLSLAVWTAVIACGQWIPYI